ncbi:MAG: type IV pilin protein [Calditrichaceae bacterium]
MIKAITKNISSIKAFTLIELMVVVAIVGLLSSIAIAIFINYDCFAKQSEAKSSLSTIFKAQVAYFGEHGVYSTTLAAISFSLRGDQLYTYEAGGNGNTFTATAIDGPKGDAWSINQDHVMINTTNGCSQ